MRSGSNSKGTTKDHHNVEGDNGNKLTLPGSDDKMNENNQTQGRLQEFAQEVMVEARTTAQGNHQELLDRKLKSMKTKAAVPVAPLGPFEQFAEDAKEEDRATLDYHEEHLEKKLQPITMDGIVANSMSEDSTQMVFMMAGNEPETITQSNATPGAVAIMGTNSPLMDHSHQFSSAINVNELTVPESTNTTTLQQMEEQAIHYAAATLVVDEYSGSVDPPVLANATKIDNEAIEQAIRKRQVKAAVVSFVLAIAAAGIAYAIYAFTRPKSVIDAPDETLTLNPSVNPSASPSSTMFAFIVNQSFDNGTALYSRGSSQNQAFAWIEDNIDGTQLEDNTYLLQLYSLLTLYYNTSGFGWRDFGSTSVSTPWLEGVNYCSWSGVGCNFDGSVTSLDLNSRSLVGSIPLELGHLSGLAVLDLGSNTLRGTLPSEIGLLTSLTYCQIDDNTFAGPLPSEIGQLTALTVLGVAFNTFSGKFTTEIGRLTELETLTMDRNSFQGSIPTEIGLLRYLTNFNIVKNMMSGELPTELGHLTDLTYLGLASNEFNGSIPSEIFLLTDLMTLFLFENTMSGKLSTELGHLTALTFLGLAKNKFNGSIPTEIFLLTDLNTLYLYANKFTGSLSTEIRKLTSLKIFSIDDNQFFSGPLCTEIGLLSSLELLSFSFNEFNGTLPTEIGQLTSLTKLDLSDNLLEGTSPTEIGLLNKLTYLTLSSNQLSGIIPTEIGQLTLLTHLHLSGNQFSGTIPSEFDQLTNLIYYDF